MKHLNHDSVLTEVWRSTFLKQQGYRLYDLIRYQTTTLSTIHTYWKFSRKQCCCTKPVYDVNKRTFWTSSSTTQQPRLEYGRTLVTGAGRSKNRVSLLGRDKSFPLLKPSERFWKQPPALNRYRSPKQRHLSHYGTIFPVPCSYQSMSCFINHFLSSTLRSSSVLRARQFSFSAGEKNIFSCL